MIELLAEGLTWPIAVTYAAYFVLVELFCYYVARDLIE